MDLCEGSYIMQRFAPAKPEEASDVRDSGTAIHAALSQLKPFLLDNDDELKAAEFCLEKMRLIAAECLGLPDLKSADVLMLDNKRIWMHDPNTGKKLCSGLADVIIRKGFKWLILDYKLGYNNVTPAPENKQLRMLGAAVFHQCIDPVTDGDDLSKIEVYVAIVAPHTCRRVSVACYSVEDLIRAENEIISICRAAGVMKGIPETLDATALKLTPGPKQCFYCKAVSYCPKAIDSVRIISNAGAIDTLSDDELTHLLDSCVVAEAVIEETKKEAKARIEKEPGAIPGWEIKPGRSLRAIEKPQEVFNRFLSLGGTQERFIATISIPVGGLKDAIKTTTGERGKTLDARFDELTAGCVSVKESKPSLSRT